MIHQRTHPSPVEGCFGCKVGSVRLGVARLKADNQGHYTQAQLAREIFDGAKQTGKDIQQVRGRRRPHEVKRNGNWEKT